MAWISSGRHSLFPKNAAQMRAEKPFYMHVDVCTANGEPRGKWVDIVSARRALTPNVAVIYSRGDASIGVAKFYV